MAKYVLAMVLPYVLSVRSYKWRQVDNTNMRQVLPTHRHHNRQWGQAASDCAATTAHGQPTSYPSHNASALAH